MSDRGGVETSSRSTLPARCQLEDQESQRPLPDSNRGLDHLQSSALRLAKGPSPRRDVRTGCGNAMRTRKVSSPGGGRLASLAALWPGWERGRCRRPGDQVTRSQQAPGLPAGGVGLRGLLPKNVSFDTRPDRSRRRASAASGSILRRTTKAPLSKPRRGLRTSWSAGRRWHSGGARRWASEITTPSTGTATGSDTDVERRERSSVSTQRSRSSARRAGKPRRRHWWRGRAETSRQAV